MAKQWTREEEDKLFDILAGAYVAEVVGILPEKVCDHMCYLIEEYPDAESWEELVEGEYGITEAFVRAVYDLCVGTTGGKGQKYALDFILNGMGCPRAVQELDLLLAMAGLEEEEP